MLKGTIDTHVHFAPHGSTHANTDVLSLSALAVKAGMCGLVLKCNTFPSVGFAYLAQKMYPDLNVFGGIVINHQIGGFNAVAIESALKFGEGITGKYCRFVCLPTFTAENDVLYHRRNIEPLHCLDRQGRVIDSLKRIFDLMASSDQVLMTGHLAERELFPVIEQAQATGVQKIVVPHPLNPVVNLSLTAQKQLAQKGVYLQQCCVETYPYFHKKYGTGLSMEDLVEAIRAVGVAHTIVATDLGADPGMNPNPVQGFQEYLGQLNDRGFTDEELRSMSIDNPSKLLGIKV